MYKKLSLVLSLALLINPAVYGFNSRNPHRCANEILNCKKALETKQIMAGFEDPKLFNEFFDIYEAQQRQAGPKSFASNLKMLLMIPEFIKAVPFLGTIIKQIPFVGQGLPKGMQPGDLIFLSKQDAPETYAMVEKHALAMNIDIKPTILLSRAKNIETNPATNLLQATGCVVIPELLLKMKINDNKLEGIVVRELSQIKRAHKATGFVATLLESNLAFGLAEIAVGLITYQLLKSNTTTSINLEAELTKQLEVGQAVTQETINGIVATVKEATEHGLIAAKKAITATGLKYYKEYGKRWVKDRHILTQSLIALTPNAVVAFVWARALKHIQKDTDLAAAYNTKATQSLIDYLQFEEGREEFNMELWETGEKHLENPNMSMLGKLAGKAMLYCMKKKFTINSYLYSGNQELSDRIKYLEARLKRYQPIEVE
ncbi:hypothetical protein HOM50_00705 [bacterium]|jgi:hypothetical protein|nr:hypothetical protein [bacterium]MBT5014911.1 hypothetical protein [bacterium]